MQSTTGLKNNCKRNCSTAWQQYLLFYQWILILKTFDNLLLGWRKQTIRIWRTVLYFHVSETCENNRISQQTHIRDTSMLLSLSSRSIAECTTPYRKLETVDNAENCFKVPDLRIKKLLTSQEWRNFTKTILSSPCPNSKLWNLRFTLVNIKIDFPDYFHRKTSVNHDEVVLKLNELSKQPINNKELFYCENILTIHSITLQSSFVWERNQSRATLTIWKSRFPDWMHLLLMNSRCVIVRDRNKMNTATVGVWKL